MADAQSCELAGIWLVYWRMSSGKPCVEYEHSVEEALCFGWIDGLMKTIDGERFARRFTPRTSASSWSASNLARAKRLVDAGRMTKAGLAHARAALANAGTTTIARKKTDAPRIPADFGAALRADPIARKNLAAFAPGSRLAYLRWITDARRAETRARRITEAVKLVRRNVKRLMK